MALTEDGTALRARPAAGHAAPRRDTRAGRTEGGLPSGTERADTGSVTPAAAAAAADARAMPGRLPWPIRIYLLAVMIPITFNIGPLFMTSLRVVLLVMILPLMLRLFLGHFGRVMAIDILFILHMGWAGIALAANNPEMVVTQMGSIGPEFLGGYLMARAYIRSRADFLALCRWLMMMVLFLLPFALYETRTGTPPIIQFLRSLPGVGSLHITNMEPRMGLNRVQGVMTHPIHHGLFASTVLTLTFVALRGVISTPMRYLVTIGVALCTFLSLSSGAILPILMQGFLIIWAMVLRNMQARWYLLLGLTALAYVVVDILSTRSPVQVFFSYATFSAHNAYWRGFIFEWGLKNVWANPLLGIGLNDWVRPDFMQFNNSVDNFWLLMAMRYGIPGFLLIAIGYAIGMVRVAFRDFRADPDLARLRLAWMITFVGLTFTLATVHVWTTVYSFVFFMFGAGMWFITATPGPAAPRTAEPAAARRAGTLPARGAPPPPSSPGPQTPAATAPGPRYTRFDGPPRRRPQP